MNGRAATVAGYAAGFALLLAIWHLAATTVARSANRNRSDRNSARHLHNRK